MTLFHAEWMLNVHAQADLKVRPHVDVERIREKAPHSCCCSDKPAAQLMKLSVLMAFMGNNSTELKTQLEHEPCAAPRVWTEEV